MNAVKSCCTARILSQNTSHTSRDFYGHNFSFLTFCKKDIRQGTSRYRVRPLVDRILMSLADIVSSQNKKDFSVIFPSASGSTKTSTSGMTYDALFYLTTMLSCGWNLANPSSVFFHLCNLRKVLLFKYAIFWIRGRPNQTFFVLAVLRRRGMSWVRRRKLTGSQRITNISGNSACGWVLEKLLNRGKSRDLFHQSAVQQCLYYSKCLCFLSAICSHSIDYIPSGNRWIFWALKDSMFVEDAEMNPEDTSV